MVLSSDLQNEIEDIVSKVMQTWNVPGLLGESQIPCIKIPEDSIDPLAHMFKTV